ncbi:MAG: response regulator transcription factor [Nitrosomonas sp.]|uniref:response regulator transcription factor n=1 Tax=Nitrosomonas sp. TaxID=42353 RepID=UPI002736BCF2|nr:response regulator transcription factor [Nitrosomonas sp.]MDP3662373.1 response regulator transcription factor [Nitrosomonas sp.]MDZ4105566.1 response regulator transcription factor [Nitrosomonas sp.]
MKNKISILLIDDHPVVRTGYRRLLESTPDMCVVAEADSGEKGYQLYVEHQPDVTILDLNMPGIGGLETIRRIKAYNPAAGILVFSMLNNIMMAQRSFEAGARGFISKQSGIGEMIHAVQQVNSGKKYIESELAALQSVNAVNAVDTDTDTDTDTSKSAIDRLTKREFQIFKLIAEGNSNAQIAKKLTISHKTVGVHHVNLMRKLQLQNSAQLVRAALDYEVIINTLA